MGIFAIIVGTISSFVLTQGTYGRALYAREVALHVAEAGLEYYRWFLAHNPSIMDDGTGLVSPHTYAVDDPEGGSMGDATITASASLQCGAVQWVDLVSKGVADANPVYPRTLSARYMQPSAAEYSYLLNGNVWAGASRTIRGPYHSNGGIRMDAEHNSDVTSAQTTWTCDAGSGCPSTQNGVFGAGSNPALWTSPASSVNFDTIDINLFDLEERAETQGGIHYGPASGSVNNRGYHLIFNEGGTVTIYRVTSTDGFWSYSSQYNWTVEYSEIDNETLLGTFAVPSDCALMFFEDRVWIEGTVDAKVTVVAATPNDSGTSPDAYLNDNIYYSDYDGTDGLTVIAERNVLIPLVVPNDMEIHGIFIASDGHYGRDYFTTSGSRQVPSQYDQYVTRNQLTTVGTVVSNGRTGTAWTDGSGFQTRNDYYDQQLAFSPPPFTPIASPNFNFSLWREE